MVPVLVTTPVTVKLFGTLVSVGLAQTLLTLRLGEGQNTLNEQVALALTFRPRQSVPVAVAVLTMLLWPHKALVIVSVVLQGIVPPGAKVAPVRTGLLLALSSVTVTFVNVMLPQLLTMPLKVIGELP